jgi:hypothetical protein
MSGKVPVFAALVKVRRRAGPEDTFGSPAIFREVLR